MVVLRQKLQSDTSDTIEFRTADIADGDLRILAKIALKTSAGTDAVSI